ncbi:FCRL6 protein, partial [Polypterus senegalus]
MWDRTHDLLDISQRLIPLCYRVAIHFKLHMNAMRLAVVSLSPKQRSLIGVFKKKTTNVPNKQKVMCSATVTPRGRKEKGADETTPSEGAMDPLDKEGDSAVESNDDVVYSDLVKGKLMMKRDEHSNLNVFALTEKMPDESTDVLYSDIKTRNATVRGAKLQLKSNEPIYEGDEVSLHCQLDGNPVGWTYEIYKEASTHSYLHKVQTESTLTFSPVTQSQRGYYRCRAGKGGVYSTYSEYVWLEVSERFSKPTLSVLPSATVWEGDTVTLRCLSKSEVTGIQMTYEFYEDETPLSEETQQNEFTVESAHQNQTGKYWCDVKEKWKETVKKQSDRVQLTVKGK